MKEVDAAEKRLNLYLTTRDEETVMLTGGDFEANWPRIKKEERMIKGIQPNPPPASPRGTKPADQGIGNGVGDQITQGVK